MQVAHEVEHAAHAASERRSPAIGCRDDPAEHDSRMETLDGVRPDRPLLTNRIDRDREVVATLRQFRDGRVVEAQVFGRRHREEDLHAFTLGAAPTSDASASRSRSASRTSSGISDPAPSRWKTRWAKSRWCAKKA